MEDPNEYPDLEDIRMIIPTSGPLFAAFKPNPKHDIELKVVPVLALALVSYEGGERADETVGQIAVGDTIAEVPCVDEEEGFGEFVGYFTDESDARTTVLATLALESYDDEGE